MCQYSLRSQSGGEPGGTWTYLGFNASDPSGPFNQTPAIPLVTQSPGANLVGDNPTVNALGKTPGFYRFRYYVTNTICDDESFMTVQVAAPTCAGNPVTKTVCTTSPVVDIMQELSVGATCAVQQGNLTPNQLTVNPAITAPGTYTYTNSVPLSPYPGFSLECNGNCSTSAALTLIVVPGYNPGTPGANPYFVCSSFNPFDMLVGASNTGRWVLQSGGPVTISINNTSVNLTNGSTISTTHNPSIVMGAAPFGTYVFRYIVNFGQPCQAHTDVTFNYGPTPNAGVGTLTNYCTGDYLSTNPGPINLFSRLTGSPQTTGTWGVIFPTISNPATVNQTLVPIFNASLNTNGPGVQDDTLTLGTLTTGFIDWFIQSGLSTFTIRVSYTITPNGTPLYQNCGTSTAFINFILNRAGYLGDSLYPQNAPYVYTKPTTPGNTEISLAGLFDDFTPPATMFFTPFSPGSNNPLSNIKINGTLYTYNNFAQLPFGTNDYLRLANFDQVPAGLYAFQVNTVSTSGLCPTYSEIAYVRVVDPTPSCTVDVSITPT